MTSLMHQNTLPNQQVIPEQMHCNFIPIYLHPIYLFQVIFIIITSFSYLKLLRF